MCVKNPQLISPNIWKIKTAFTNSYLIKCNHGYLLVDTGYPNQFSHFRKKLAEIGVSPTDIKHLFLTHHHDDHSGFAKELLAESGATCIVHKNAIPYLQQGCPEETGQPVNRAVSFIFKIFTLFHKNFAFPAFSLRKNDVLIQEDDNEFLKSIGIDGIILSTPGHTDDSISLLLSDGKAFVGNLAMNFMKFCMIGHRPIYV
ncbi:MAG: MBL fold metallo-hydrolase [Fidelibacterota bacterium]